MTLSEKKALRRDMSNPLHFFTIIVENNPEGVSNQMQAWGLTYSDSKPEQMVAELVKAYNAGGQIKAQSLAIVRNVKYKFGVLPAGFDEAITGQAPPPKMLNTNGQESGQNWYTEMDWGRIIDVIFTGVASVTGGGTTPAPGPAPGPAQGPAPGPGGPAEFNPQWIAVGVAVVVVIMAFFIAMRK